MSFNLFFDRSKPRRTVRRANRGHAGRRPRFETFEDRRMLSFDPAVNYPVGTSPASEVTGHFNNDGRLDLAVAGPNSVSVLLGNADGTFQPARTSAGSGNPLSLAAGDFDDDGNLDLAMVNGAGDYSSLRVMFGNGNGTFQAPSTIDIPLGTKPRSVAVGDFNSDGTMDLGLGADVDYAYPGDIYADDGQASVLLSNGDRTFAAPSSPVWIGYEPDGAVVADFNGDTFPDLVVGVTVYDPTEFGAVRVLLGDGAGNIALAQNINWIFEHGSSMVAGDVDGDGDADLVSANDADIRVRLGNGLGGFQSPARVYPAGFEPSSAVLGDFTGDGVLDIAAANWGSNDVSILRGRGDGTFETAENFAVGPGGSGIAVGDFNGDGRPDVAAANSGSNTVSVLLNDGSWSNATVPGDADGDQDVDGADFLLWQRTLGAAVIPSGSGADWNTSGQIDAADLGFWNANFGDAPAPSDQEGAARAAVRTLINDEEGVHGEAPAATVPLREPYALPAASRSLPAARSPVFGVIETRDRAIDRHADAARAAPTLQRVAMAAGLSPLSQVDHDRDDDRLSLLSEDQADEDADSFRVAVDHVFRRLGTRDQEVSLRH